MKFRKNILTLFIISSFYVSTTVAADLDGYGNETPDADNTGFNYPDKFNDTNPYIDYENGSLIGPNSTVQNPIPVYSTIGEEASSYRDNFNAEGITSPQAYNFEGNNLISTPEDRSAISAGGSNTTIVFYKNNANYISLAATDGATLLVDSNSASGAIIDNDNAFILLKKNYANDASITNKNQSTMVIDGNAVNGAGLINDSSRMDIYHNNAVGVTIDNLNGASLTALGNNISDSVINNGADATFTIGDCNSSVCADTVGTTAQNITLNNDGQFNLSGDIDLSGSDVNNQGNIYGTSILNLTGSTIKNSGTFDLAGDINLDNSTVNNDGDFLLSDATVNMTDTRMENAGALTLSNVVITGGAVENTGTITLNGTNKASMDVTNSAEMLISENSSIDIQNSEFINEESGRVSFYNGSDITGDITNRGRIQLVSQNDDPVHSTLNGDIANYGLLSLASSERSVGNTLTINGNYTGYSGSQIMMNSVLNDDSSTTDKLHIAGNAAGESAVYINNIGGHGAQTIEGLNVITVDGISDAQFTQGGRIVAGAYDYSLVKAANNSGNWYLTSKDNTPVAPTDPVDPSTPAPTDPVEPSNPTDPADPTTPVEPEKPSEPSTPPVDPAPSVSRERPEAGSYIANIAAANTLFNTRLEDRSGETHYRDLLTGEQKTTSLWMRNEGGHNRWRSGSGQLKTQSNRYVLQLGGDLGKWTLNGSDSLSLGAMVGYANSKSRTHSSLTGYGSKGSVNGYSAGLYSTWYADAQTKTGMYVDTWLQYNWFDNSVKGDGLSSEYYHSRGITASVETGYTLKIRDFTPSTGTERSWYIQPQAQIMWMGVKAKNHTEMNGTQVKSEGDGNVQTRLGVKTYLSGRASQDAQRDRLFQPFIEANWIHNTETFAARMDDRTVNQAGARNMGEVRVGVEGTVTNNLNIWGNVGTRIGDKGYSDNAAMLGVKYSF